MPQPLSRRLALAAAVLAGVLALSALAWQAALQRLQAGIVEALGPRAQLGALEVGWSGITLHALRIAGEGRSWPAADELRAARVRIEPDLRSAFSGPWRVRRIEVEGGYLAVLRTRAGGLRVLPSLLDPPPAQRGRARAEPRGKRGAEPQGAPVVHVGEVALRDVQVEFIDASLRTGLHRVQLRQLRADLGPLVLPALDRPVPLALEGVVQGPQRQGRVWLQGRVTPASRDARLQARLQGVDLVALQPYLLTAAETGVRRGALDLKLDATVQGQRLHAPGVVTLTGLELGHGSGPLGTFAGVPRQAVLAAMSREGRIELRFTLDGRLDDPRFSLNENIATRLASGLAENLGVSVAGVVEGVGSMLKGLLGR